LELHGGKKGWRVVIELGIYNGVMCKEREWGVERTIYAIYYS